MKTRIFSGLFLILSIILAGVPCAQAQDRPTIEEIEIQYAGPRTVSRERILANMRTAVGKPYSDQAVNDDIRNLYASGNIQNVRIFGEPLPSGGVKVIVVVLTKAKVTEVQIAGVTKLKTKTIRKELLVRPDEILNEASMEQDRQQILELYQKKGFPDTEVAYEVNVDEDTGTAVVVYTVTEGVKTAINKIEFEGNTAFKAKELRKQIKTKSLNILSFLTQAGRLNQETIDTDLVTLKEFYQNHGYLDVVIGTPRFERINNKKADMIIPIEEGPVYTVGDITIEGAQVFTIEEVRSRMKLQPGDVFSPEQARADVKSVQDLYGERGYIDLVINADTALAGGTTLNVFYSLEEGTETYVERINISGNTKTKDKVIRRELLITPGELYDTVRVDISKQRLGNLNYFERVDTYPTDTLVPGRKDLNVLVEEKRTGSFNFGAGFSSIDSLLGFAEIQQSNFDLLGWPTFTGGGQRFRTRLQYGTERKDFVISLTEPWFLDYQLAVGGEIFYREADFLSAVYSQRDYGFELNTRKGLTSFTSISFAYRLENITIFDVASDATPAILAEEGTRSKSSISSVFTYDSRDSVFLTRRGWDIDVAAQVAGGFLGFDTQTYGFGIEASRYFPLVWDMIFILNGEIAVTDDWGSGNEVPIFERLYLGGANNLRGFSFREVGPKDSKGNPIGGNSLGRITTELTFPIISRVRGAVFYDAGFVNAGAYDFGTSNYNSDYGIGLRLDLPIGPVRIDYGIPIKSDRWNDSSGRFNFNIGYQF